MKLSLTSEQPGSEISRRAFLIVYPGAPHGVTDTHKDRLNADLLGFIQS